MGALQYVDVSGYSALLLRRTYAELALPEGLMDRAHAWLGPTDAHWDGLNRTWRFPPGATLTFGYLQYEKDKFRYQSSAFQYIGFDELTEFLESMYRFLFSRLRRLKGVKIPLRMRSGSNPGNIGHNWVKRRFLDEGPQHGRIFIPATKEDNPYLDWESYTQSLAELDPITRRQLEEGDWTARHGGSLFRREWFTIVDAVPADLRALRYWDLAATESAPGKKPAWTAGVKVGVSPKGFWYVLDVQRFRATPLVVEQRIRQTAQIDGLETEIWIEQEPGAAGVNTVDHYQREVLADFNCRGHRVSGKGSKEERSRFVSSKAEAGLVKLLSGPWIGEFLDELEAFPFGMFKDQVDALSGAFLAAREYLGFRQRPDAKSPEAQPSRWTSGHTGSRWRRR